MENNGITYKNTVKNAGMRRKSSQRKRTMTTFRWK